MDNKKPWVFTYMLHLLSYKQNRLTFSLEALNFFFRTMRLMPQLLTLFLQILNQSIQNYWLIWEMKYIDTFHFSSNIPNAWVGLTLFLQSSHDDAWHNELKHEKKLIPISKLWSESPSGTLHSKKFQKTLILAFEANCTLFCQNGLFSAF